MLIGTEAAHRVIQNQDAPGGGKNLVNVAQDVDTPRDRQRFGGDRDVNVQQDPGIGQKVADTRRPCPIENCAVNVGAEIDQAIIVRHQLGQAIPVGANQCRIVLDGVRRCADAKRHHVASTEKFAQLLFDIAIDQRYPATLFLEQRDKKQRQRRFADTALAVCNHYRSLAHLDPLKVCGL